MRRHHGWRLLHDSRWTPDMDMTARTGIIDTIAPILFLLLLGSPAAAQQPKTGSYLKHIELCNGSDRISAEDRIAGCTALIDAGDATTNALVIAHNNRGNAYILTADYDRAIRDFDQAIKLN